MIRLLKHHNDYFILSLVLRYAIFASFYILSIRLVFITITYAPLKDPLLLVPLLLAVAVLSWLRILWTLYGFLAAVPLISGLQVVGLIPSALPLLSFIFACTYLMWFPKRLFLDREDISPRAEIGHWVDLLSGIVLLSLLFGLGVQPLDRVWNQAWFFPLGMGESVQGVEAAYTFLQGLFFYRIMEKEVSSQRAWRFMIKIFYIHASIIILFSFFQLIFRIPDPHYGLGFFAPFDDVHSYGSYIAALFFLLLTIGFGRNPRRRVFIWSFLGLIFLLVILSYSRATWLAVIVVSAVFLINKLSTGGKVLAISSVLLVLLTLNLFPNVLIKSNHPYVTRLGQLLIQKEQLSDDSRIVLWKRAVNIISDFPITGSGMGTFWKISPLYQDWDISKLRNFHENTHNYFLQLASESGLPSLLIFLSIFFFTYKTGIRVSSQVPEVSPSVKGLLFGLNAYLITCVTGHPLLLSNQQFLFWFIIASIATSRTFTNDLQGDRTNRLPRETFRFMVVLTIMVLAGYALEYGPSFWRVSNKEKRYEYGFYSYENWNGKRVRWMAKKAFSKTVVTGSVMDFDVYVAPYNIGLNGINLTVFINGKLWDEINFFGEQMRNRKFYIPYKKNDPIELKIAVNKTFTPIRLGLNKDPRTLGVALGEINFYDGIPKEGIGFWAAEQQPKMQIQGWAKNVSAEVRLTGLRASMNIEHRVKDGITLFLKVGHPDAEKNPVKIKILCNSRIIEEVTCCDHQWKRIHLDEEKLMDSNVLTFHANRTWNPKRLGLSEDHRDLGVTVAIIEPVSPKP